MPVTVQDVLDRIVAYDLDFEAEESINDTKKEYTDRQREQLFSGVNEDSEKILPEYTVRTVAIKKKKGQPTDRVTLKDTGSFYREIFIDPRKDEFIVDSADEKSAALQEKYGEEIFGLTEQNQEGYVSENLEPIFYERTQKNMEL